MTDETRTCAFAGSELLSSGTLEEAARALKQALDAGDRRALVAFDEETGRQTEIDLRGTVADVVGRLAPETGKRGPGRPRLGVVGREVTLLPRHWEWLASQPGGASVALRKLVDQARRESEEADRVRTAREAAYRLMTSLAGDLEGYEEATRALFAGDRARFEDLTDAWPEGLRDVVRRTAAGGW